MLMYKGPVMASQLGNTICKYGSSDGLIPGEHRLLMYKGPVMASYLGSIIC